MKYSCVFLLVSLAGFVSGQVPPPGFPPGPPPFCVPDNGTCTDSWQCCTAYCRDTACTIWGRVADEQELADPCANGCPDVPFRPCIIRQVECAAGTACPGVADCSWPAWPGWRGWPGMVGK